MLFLATARKESIAHDTGKKATCVDVLFYRPGVLTDREKENHQLRTLELELAQTKATRAFNRCALPNTPQHERKKLPCVKVNVFRDRPRCGLHLASVMH